MSDASPLIIDIAGTTLAEADRRRLAHPLVGGLILFARNWQDRRQLIGSRMPRPIALEKASLAAKRVAR